jgi:hypothetical protein
MEMPQNINIFSFFSCISIGYKFPRLLLLSPDVFRSFSYSPEALVKEGRRMAKVQQGRSHRWREGCRSGVGNPEPQVSLWL